MKKKLDKKMAEYMRKIRELQECEKENESDRAFEEFRNYCKKEGIEPILFTDIAAEIARIIEDADKNSKNVGILEEEYIGHQHANVRYINFEELTKNINLDICELGLRILLQDLIDLGDMLSIHYEKCDKGYVTYFRINDMDANNTQLIKIIEN